MLNNKDLQRIKEEQKPFLEKQKELEEKIKEEKELIYYNIWGLIKGIFATIIALECTVVGLLLNVILLAIFQVQLGNFLIAFLIIQAVLSVITGGIIVASEGECFEDVEPFEDFDKDEIIESLEDIQTYKEEIQDNLEKMKTAEKETIAKIEEENKPITFDDKVVNMLFELTKKSDYLEPQVKLLYLNKIKEIASEYNAHYQEACDDAIKSENEEMTPMSFDAEVVRKIAILDLNMQKDIISSMKAQSVNEECIELESLINKNAQNKEQSLKLTR